jgi:D-beta-D-heptose 7-phosphate kinase/D-beta-D-heptose 1-phosphate adenosyltransferase
MQRELPRFDQARVLVIGDIMLDRYWEGRASRISPEAPVPVVRVEQIVDRPGGAGNVALNIAVLGVQTRLCGVTGDDAAADTLQDMLRSAGVRCAFTRLPGRATITKLRVISQHQQLIRLDFEESVTADHAPFLVPDLEQQLSGCGALVLSDYAKGTLLHPAAMIAEARARAIPVLVDPKGVDFARYRGASLLTPNLQEFEAVVGACPTEADMASRAQRLMAQHDLGALLVTRGEHGMTLLRAGDEALHFPARAREVFDVTGAGDTVIGVLAAAIAAGAALPEAVGLANIAAGIVVGKLGTAVVSAPELRRAMARERGEEPGGARGAERGFGREVARGVLSQEQLRSAVSAARARGERLVFTNGCFDILHAGHVRYLEQARQLGDRLIVAVNSDESVRRLKGRGRPINPQARRMAVLAALGAVDWVVGFDEDTPSELLRALRPDMLAKGGDYRNKEDVVGWDIVEAYGGEVRLMGVLDDVSTTAIVGRIKNESKG